MCSDKAKLKIVEDLLSLIESIVRNPNLKCQDGFFAFIEICYRDAETVNQVLERVRVESGIKQASMIRDFDHEKLNEHLPLEKCIIESFRKAYYQCHDQSRKS